MDKLLYKGINRYFDILSSFGYIDYLTTKQLLVINYIRELYSNVYISCLKEEDKILLQQVFYKLINKCKLFKLINAISVVTNSIDIYYGNTTIVPTTQTLVSSSKVTYTNNLSFRIPGDLTCIWFAVPSNVTPKSVINTGFAADEFLSDFSTQVVQVASTAYTLYYYSSTRALGSDALVTLN